MLNKFQPSPLNVAKQVYRFKERILEQVAHKNYYTARAYYHHQLHRFDNRYKHPPLLVYQMGKVGSSSVTKSLKQADLDRRIYHIHFLTPELVNTYEKKRKVYLSTEREGDLKHIWQYQYLYQRIQKGLGGKKWKVITLVRDPIARNISEFFEHIDVLSSSSGQQWHLRSIEYDYEIIIDDNNIEELIQLFFERLNHDTAMNYFDQEFKNILKIDLFSTDFPVSQGYKIYQEKDVDVLLIRLENLNDCFTKACKEFLDIDNIVLVDTNVSDNKEYSNLYKKFKEIIYLPEPYIDRIYSSKFARHFYSPSEINRFREIWSKKSIAKNL